MVFTHTYQANISRSWRMLKFALIFALHGLLIIWLIHASIGASSIVVPSPVYLRTFDVPMPKPKVVKAAAPTSPNTHPEQTVLPMPVQPAANIDPAPMSQLVVPMQVSQKTELPAPVEKTVELTAAPFDADYLQNPSPCLSSDFT